MKKKIYEMGIRAIVTVGITATLSLVGAHEASANTITTCESGTELSFDQAIDGIAWGLIIIDRVPDLSANVVTVTVTNNTPCNLPASLSDHKMYIDYDLATLSQQEFFSGTPTRMVAPFTTEVFSTPIAPCLSQYDLWYGDYLVVIPDFLTWGKLLSGDQVRLGQYCVHDIVPVVVVPITASLDADTICAIPGEPITFTASASGDGILSKTLEKDTNSDGSYGEVATWGAGPGTNSFSSSEGVGYSGVYSIKFLVNGTEMGRKDVTVSTSCTPVVVVPVVVPPVVVPSIVVPVVVPPIVVPVVVPPIVIPPIVVTVVVPPVVETVIVANVEEPPSSSTSGGGGRSRRAVVTEVMIDVTPEVIAFIPGLPDTGFGPLGKSMLLNLASLFGLIGLVIFFKFGFGNLARR